jgi:Domain of unknown function (DUF1864)
MKSFSPEEILEFLETWTRFELPMINRQLEGKDAAELLIERLRPLCDLAAPLAGRPMNAEFAARMLQCLAFGVSSVERHMQWSGHKPGDGVLALGVTDLLLHLGRVAGQPPRDSYRSYWLANPGPAPLTFTGSYQEAMFHRIVNETEALHQASVAALRPICDGTVPFASEAAVDAMEKAILHHEKLTAMFKSFMLPAVDRPKEWAMTKTFFALSMRTYLCSYPIASVEWSGPNAANIPGQALLDFAIGTVDDEYRATVRSRFELLHERDRAEILAAMDRPSVLDRVLETIGLQAADLGDIQEGDLVPRFLARRDCMPSLAAFCELVKAAAHLSATHFALIHNYLRRMAQETPPEVRAKLPVKLDHGTGNMEHDGTRRIMEMRKEHPIATRVVAAIRAAA